MDEDTTSFTARMGDIELRQGDLQYRVEVLEAHLRDAANTVDLMRRELSEVSARLNPLAPKRHHCPKCKTLLHSKAVVCRCGWSKEGSKADAKAGLPG